MGTSCNPLRPVPAGHPGRINRESRQDRAKVRYTQEQRNAVLAAVAEYHLDIPVAFGVDFGHTEPQYVIPSGGTVTIDSASQRIEVSY